MWTHEVQRLVPRPVAEVREEIARIVDAAWCGATDVTTTEHHGRRADWIAAGVGSDELDIVLTWALTDLDHETHVVLTLDEFDAGPDPTDEMEAILDMVVATTRGSRP
jgi:hypothetical protein